MNARTRLILTLALFLGLLAAVPGCHTSANQRLAIANDSFASTLDYLSDAREAGQIDDATQTQVIAPARRTINSLLDLAYLAAERGEGMKLNLILAEIDRELTPLLRQRFALRRQERK